MKKTRTLKSGRTVSLHRNDGLRKRCDCARRAWTDCPHPWHFSFKKKGGKHHRFPIDRHAGGRPVQTREDAKTEADRLRALIRGGWDPDAAIASSATTQPDLTFDQFAEKWRERARATDPNVGKSQRLNDASICARIGNTLVSSDRLGARLIVRITEDDIEAVFAQLAVLKASTWNKYRDVIRMLQTWGVEKGYLARPWAREQAITHRSEKGDRRERRLVADVLDDKSRVKTPGEERRLLEKASPWLQRLIIAALETGCRRGELLSLQWRDVDSVRGLLTIRSENAKTRTSRRIPTSQRLRGILAMIDKDPKGNEHKPTAFVFGDRVGGQVKDPKKAWAACCKAAGVLNLHFHDLRHEAGSRMLEAGVPLHHVQAILGHADAKTTSTYLNATVEHLIESMKRFDVQPLHPLAQSTVSEPPPLVQQESSEAVKVLVN